MNCVAESAKSATVPVMSLPDYPMLFWVTAVAAVILVGIAKAGFGGGVGVIATPLMALTIPVADAAALLLPLLILIDLISIRHYWGQFDRPSLKVLLPSAIIGIALGTLFFQTFSDNERALKLGIGILAILFVLYRLGQTALQGAVIGKRLPGSVGHLLGALAGFTSTLAHAGGPPVTIYLLPQKMPRTLFVGSTVIFFTIVNLVKLIPYSLLGLIQVGNLTTILLLSPLCFLGVRLGLWLNEHFTDLWFNRLVYTLLLLTGIQLVVGQSFITLLAGN
ncbi:MAG: sulfite exporter TauE/SafE family protein [Anaerolineales bacterium]|nr:sulfite exporter TauE/SafE family protein [Anaerolineales bacterium]